MAQRISRKDMKHDKFVEDVGLAYGYVQKNRTRLIGALAAVAAVAAIIGAFWMYRSGQEHKAQARLGDAIVVLESPTTATAPGAPAPRYKSEDEKTAQAIPILNEVTSKYGSTDAADVAQLYLARIAAAKGDTASARSKLQKFLDEHPKNILAGGAQVSLYEMDINSGKAKEVAAELEKKVNANDTVLPTDALLSLLARAYDNLGEHPKARDLYRRIMTEFPDSPYASDAQAGAASV